MEEVGEADSFDKKKQQYFTRLGLGVREALSLHKEVGLWDRVEGSPKRDWGNVSEHCLVEVARVGVLANLLGVSGKAKDSLKLAAGMHDFFKKGEKEIATSGGLDWNSFERASEEATKKMRLKGVSGDVVRLVNSVGHGSLKETEEILQKEELGEQDLAFLAMHYVDDYTIGSSWVEQGNVLRDRMMANSSNSRYAVLNEEGRKYFNGETTYEAQLRIGQNVENRLFQEISKRKEVGIGTSSELPMLVDSRIKEDIETMAA